MHTPSRWILLIAVGLLVGACSPAGEVAGVTSPPLMIDEPEGSEVSRLMLSQRAAERLGIETVAVADAPVDGTTRPVIPYGAVLYDADGTTWTYTSPEALVYVRAPIVVDRVDGDQAVLGSGPPAGTLVVTVGGAELWGAEHGVGGGH